MKNKNTIENKLSYLRLNLFSQVTQSPSSRYVYVPTITQDEDELPADSNDNFAPQRSKRKRLQEQATKIISPQAPADIL